jgi:hypothetical protein
MPHPACTGVAIVPAANRVAAANSMCERNERVMRFFRESSFLMGFQQA